MKFSAALFYLFAVLIAVIPAQVSAGDNDGGDNGGDRGNNPQRKPQPPSSCPPDSKCPDHPDHDQRRDKKKHDDKVQVLWGQCTSLSLRVSFFAIPFVEGSLISVRFLVCSA